MTLNINFSKLVIFIFLLFSIFLISCTGNEVDEPNICEPNPCAESLVAHKTTCELLGANDFKCVCETGFELKDNGSCAEKVDLCTENPCGEANKTVCTVNGDSYDCSCDSNYHLEDNRCFISIKRVSCKIENPNQPVNSTENSESVDVSWNETDQNWNETPYCTWTCFDEYQGENCDECNDNYTMNDNTCVLDCDTSKHLEANNSNDTCICTAGYHFDNSICVESVDPCSPNHCLDNDGISGKTNCIANSQTAGDYSCECEEGFEETEGNCIELTEFHIRAVSGNISSGNGQDYDLGHGIRIFQALKPNVIMIQEFNYKNNSPSDYEEMVKAVFQDPACFQENTCFYSVGLDENNLIDYRSNGIPNGIISRFPILDFGAWDDPNIPNRDLDWAILDIPGEKELFVISVHLHTSPSYDQVVAAQVIAKEIALIKEAHPNKYYYIVGGDFNGYASVDNDGFGKFEGEDIFDVDINPDPREDGPKPIGEDGGYGTNANRGSAYDWILTSSDLTAYQIPSKFCSETNSNDCKIYTNGLIFDTRDFCLPDLDRDSCQSELDKYFPPTLTGDSEGNSMQHMAIIKDFIITF